MALSYVFRQGLIHRDVKPANLLAVLDAQGQVTDVKVSDFGSALNLRSDSTQVHRVGSLAYMPPEQIEGGDVDCRADIYALGAVLYHLVAGRAPFDAPSQMALMHQIYHQAPPPLQGLGGGVTPELEAVILKALAKHPQERYADWEAFGKALSELVSKQLVPLARLYEVKDSERFNMLRELEFFADFGDVELWEVVHRARWRRFPLDMRSTSAARRATPSTSWPRVRSMCTATATRSPASARAPRSARWPIWHLTPIFGATAPMCGSARSASPSPSRRSPWVC